MAPNGDICGHQRIKCNLLGVEYSDAIPLSKSRAKSFPPVAEAA